MRASIVHNHPPKSWRPWPACLTATPKNEGRKERKAAKVFGRKQKSANNAEGAAEGERLAVCGAGRTWTSCKEPICLASGSLAIGTRSLHYETKIASTNVSMGLSSPSAEVCRAAFASGIQHGVEQGPVHGQQQLTCPFHWPDLSKMPERDNIAGTIIV